MVVFFTVLSAYVQLKQRRVFSLNMDIFVKLERADRINVKEPVLLNGMQVGTVQEVFDLGGKYIYLRLDILPNTQVPKSTLGVVMQPSYMGGRGLMFKTDTICTDDCLVSGDTIVGYVYGLKEEIQDGLKPVLAKADSILTRYGGAAGVDTMFQDAFNAVLELEKTTANLEVKMQKMGRNLPAQLQKIEKQTAALLEGDSSVIEAKIDALLATLEGIDARSLGATLEKIPQQLKDGTAKVKGFKATQDSIDQKLGNLNKLLRGYKTLNKENTVSKLLHSKAYKDSIKTTVKDLNTTMETLRKQPKKYVKLN